MKNAKDILKKVIGHAKSPEFKMNTRRRQLLKVIAGLPFMTLFSGALSGETEKTDTARYSGLKVIDEGKKETGPAEKLPTGKLGNLNVSRMILGCNLIGGWSHARDLIYTDQLFKTYHSEDKIIETFIKAEQAGINTVFMVTQYFHVLNRYKSTYNSKIQSICQTMLPEEDFFSDIKQAIDSGTTALYIHGGVGDILISSGKKDLIFKAIDYIKSQGFLAGMGAHSLETIRICEQEKIPADFYVKTFHNDDYWSAHPIANREEYSIIKPYSSDHNKYHDNMWDLFPQRTAEFMKNVRKPWFAFKVLAAGAISPEEGFRHAFENGADFITVGMFDFQIAEDVKIANQVLGSLKNREREWFS